MENELVNLIGSVGFPIVACIYMAYMHNESEKQHNESEKRHSDERVAMTKAITEMNSLLEYIKDILERETKQ